MHEVLAPLLYAVDFDSVELSPGVSSSSLPDELPELCDRNWIAADAYALFEAIMSHIRVWYEWQAPPKPVQSPSIGGQVDLKPYVAPIVQTCQEICDGYLKISDPALWRSLQRSQIEPQIYGMYVRDQPIE
jgi:TBC1 domain family protein 5